MRVNYTSYLRSLKWHFLAGFINGMLASVFFSYIPIYYSDLIKALLSDVRDDSRIYIFLYSYLLYKCIGNAFASIRGGFFIHCIGIITKRIKHDVLRKFNDLGIEFFESRSKSNIINTMRDDCDKAASVLTTNINIIIRTLTQFIITSFILYRTSARLYAILLALAFIDAFLNNTYYNYVYDRFIQRMNNVKRKQDDLVSEYIQKIEIYRVNNLDGFIQGRWDTMQHEYDRYKGFESIHYMINSFLFNIFHSLIVCCLIYSAVRTDHDYAIIHQFLMYLDDLVHLLNTFRNTYNDIVRHSENMKNVHGILERDIIIKGYYVPERELMPNIVVDIQSFQYPDTENVILDDCCLEIGYGSIFGICGRSGCGKSTLIKLIMRFYHIDDGRILFDGVNINTFDQRWLYENIFSYVNQEPILFEGTVEDNIQLFDKSKTIDPDLMSLIEDIKSKDIRVSGGQKQRIALCRAFMKRSKIIVLDEPTSALDTDNENRFLDLLQALHKKEEKTIIIVSHKSRTLSVCDDIYDFDIRIRELEEHNKRKTMMENLNKSMFGDDFNNLTEEDKIAILEEHLRFKCLD